MVDFFLMLLIAGAGDELQGIKRGILEVSDAVVINKADGDNFQRAREAQKAYESALSIVKPDSPLWKVPVLTCSSLSTRGVAGIWEIISEFRSKMNASGELDKKRRRQSLDWMWARVEEGLKKRFYQRTDIKPRIAELTGAVRKGSISPTEAALELLDLNHMPARNRR
jgi:LAO/AO transport system kinase